MSDDSFHLFPRLGSLSLAPDGSTTVGRRSVARQDLSSFVQLDTLVVNLSEGVRCLPSLSGWTPVAENLYISHAALARPRLRLHGRFRGTPYKKRVSEKANCSDGLAPWASASASWGSYL